MHIISQLEFIKSKWPWEITSMWCITLIKKNTINKWKKFKWTKKNWQMNARNFGYLVNNKGGYDVLVDMHKFHKFRVNKHSINYKCIFRKFSSSLTIKNEEIIYYIDHSIEHTPLEAIDIEMHKFRRDLKDTILSQPIRCLSSSCTSLN